MISRVYRGRIKTLDQQIRGEKRNKNKGMFGNCFSFILCFQKQFSIFETKKLVWQLKMNRKQKLFSKFNL